MEKINENIGFIGAGNMAKAIGIGLIKSGLLNDTSQVYASATSDRNLKEWNDLGANATSDNSQIVQNCEIVFLAVKPLNASEAIKSAYKEFSRCNFAATTLVSILAGSTSVTIKYILKECIPQDSQGKINVVRAMPNTPLLVGEGCTVYSTSVDSSDQKLAAAFKSQVETVRTIFSVCGFCEEVPEKMINAIGALAGSGPAYVYQMIEALSDGGVKLGIPRELSLKLAAQTLLGGAKMVLETGKHPGELKDQVCSPGGTTICGITAMEKSGIRYGLISAVEAAFTRTEEIGKQMQK